MFQLLLHEMIAMYYIHSEEEGDQYFIMPIM